MDKREAMARAADTLNRRMGPDTVGPLRPGKVRVIPTGLIGIDLALGIGGIPRGRITQIYGGESCGKTTLALQILAQAQRLRLDAAFVDAEHAFDPDYARQLGVDTDSLYMCQPESGDAALRIVRRLAQTGALGLIVVDSAAALVPESELEGHLTTQEPGAQARMLSSMLRQLLAPASRSDTAILFINQVRSRVGNADGTSPAVPCGGHALAFYAALRMELRQESLLERDGAAVGTRVGITVRKNKLAPPFGYVQLDCGFGTGFDALGDLTDQSLRMGLLLEEGPYLRLDRLRVKGREAMIDWLRQHPREARQLRSGLWLRARPGAVQPVLCGTELLLQKDLTEPAPEAWFDDELLLRAAAQDEAKDKEMKQAHGS